MFPAAMAAPFARNVACQGILVIFFSVLKIYYVLLSFLTLYYTWCHGGATVLYGYPRSIMIIITFYCGLLCSDTVRPEKKERMFPVTCQKKKWVDR